MKRIDGGKTQINLVQSCMARKGIGLEPKDRMTIETTCDPVQEDHSLISNVGLAKNNEELAMCQPRLPSST